MHRFALGRMTTLLATLVLTIWLAGNGKALAQGQYDPVSDADMVQLQLNHYFTPDKKGHAADFSWTFTKDGFVVQAGKSAIPADLMKRLLPAGAKANEIRGKWKLAGQLVLSDIIATDASGGELAGNKEAKFRIYRTAPTVVRIGEPQYVFGVGP